MNIDIADIDTKALGLSTNFDIIAKLAIADLDKNGTVSSETLSWLINPPPIYAAAESDEFKEFQKKREERYRKQKNESIQLVRAIKKEFYSFLCSDSKKYRTEREAAGTNINTTITVFSTLIAGTYGVQIGLVTAVAALLFLIAGRVGKNAYCKVYKPKRKK